MPFVHAISTHSSRGIANICSHVLPIGHQALRFSEREGLYRTQRAAFCHRLILNFVWVSVPGECSGDVVESINT